MTNASNIRPHDCDHRKRKMPLSDKRNLCNRASAAIREAGLSVPGDISVVGFDEIPIASQLHPQLTTVRQPLQQMARASVNLRLALVAGLDAPSEQIVLPTQLIVRESTVALPGRRRADAATRTAAASSLRQAPPGR